jgi:hypothetical protein
MLINFMDLVTATKLASMRSMSPARIEKFKFFMNRYLEELLLLYPGISISPSQHLSLHFVELLESFGPTPGWRCWAFERANRRLQDINTNMKFGAFLSAPSSRPRSCHVIR